MGELNLYEIWRRYDRAQQLLARKGDHPAARTRGAIRSADDVPALLAEVVRLRAELVDEKAAHAKTRDNFEICSEQWGESRG